MAFLRLEFVTAYFSDAVVGGFSTGAAFHVFVSQLKDFFGLEDLPRRIGAGNLFFKLYDIVLAIPEQLNQTVMLISLLGLLFLVLGKHYVNPWFKNTLKISVPPPFELVLLLFVTGLSAYCHFHSRHNVPIVGELATGFPIPTLPTFSLVPHLIPHAITISIVVAAIHISLAKIFGKRYNYETDPGQELYALGFSSLFSPVFPMYPVACSLSRTAVSVEAGTKTQLSTIFSSVIIAAVILYFGRLLRTLPM
uniref:Sulfate_transp domain-containing protein n=3 Tax=Bursaphelenchus xylophilus TaxID=6326 RepID=A0A1I7SHK7_BURXY